MEISGRKIAKRIKARLKIEVTALKQRGITPGLAIITLGDEASWKKYVEQKLKLAEKLGVHAKLFTLTSASQPELIALIKKLNADSSIHGIIAQRPLPKHIDNLAIIDAINPQKDIDGFAKNSPYKVPVVLAVERILQEVHRRDRSKQTFPAWLASKIIAVVGKGETAGLPTILALKRKHINPIVIDSKTPNKSFMLQKADIIISAVGHSIIAANDIKNGVVLVGVGTHGGEDGGLKGDYMVKEIEQKASFYTPTPGGVGPVNLSYLFKNLLKAAQAKQ